MNTERDRPRLLDRLTDEDERPQPVDRKGKSRQEAVVGKVPFRTSFTLRRRTTTQAQAGGR